MSVHFSTAASKCLSRGKSQQEADSNSKERIWGCAAPGSCYHLWTGAGGGRGSSYCQNLKRVTCQDLWSTVQRHSHLQWEWKEGPEGHMPWPHSPPSFPPPASVFLYLNPARTRQWGSLLVQPMRVRVLGHRARRKDSVPGGHGEGLQCYFSWRQHSEGRAMLPCSEQCWAQHRCSETLNNQGPEGDWFFNCIVRRTKLTIVTISPALLRLQLTYNAVWD